MKIMFGIILDACVFILFFRQWLTRNFFPHLHIFWNLSVSAAEVLCHYQRRETFMRTFLWISIGPNLLEKSWLDDLLK